MSYGDVKLDAYFDSFLEVWQRKGKLESPMPDLKNRRDGLINVIKVQIADIKKNQSLDKEKLEDLTLLAKYLLKHLILLKREPEIIQELFLQTIVFAYYDKVLFERFISDIAQPSILGQMIAFHNLLVEEKFKHAGINWDRWLSFKGEEGIDLEHFKKINQGNAWKKLDVLLAELEKGFEAQGNSLAGCVRKDVIMLRKNKNSLVVTSDDLIERNGTMWGLDNKFFPVFHNGRSYLHRNGKPVIIPSEAFVLFPKIRRNLAKFIPQPVKKKFSVKLWKRNPTSDLFLGNVSNCCIAIGTASLFPAILLDGVPYKKRPAGILDFLVDKGIQVAEISDESGAIGQAWLFVTMNKGKPMLVVDSIDILGGNRFCDDVLYGKAIRKCLFNFLKRYAEEIGVQWIVLGIDGALDKIKNRQHQIKHDIPTGNLAVLPTDPIEKLGGYWNIFPYFLESRTGKLAYYILMDGIPLFPVD